MTSNVKNMDTDLEIEVKFFLDDSDALRQAILNLGGLSFGRFFELNLRFDDKNANLFKNKHLLRLRKDQKNRITVKMPVAASDEQFKTLKEIEIEVDDFEKAIEILNVLGFYEVQRYEKWRETFIIGDTHLLIDTMPYGRFLEIEGEKLQILYLAEKLGLNWNERILANYLEIFEKLKEVSGLNFKDVTFAHFSRISNDYTEIIQSFQEFQKT